MKRPGSAKPRPEVLLAVAIDVTAVCQMPRFLNRAGCRVSLISRAGLAVRKSRFVDHHVQWPTGAKTLAQALYLHLRQTPRPYQRVVIGDESLVWDLVDEPFVSELADWFPFPPDPIYMGISTSNTKFMQAASEAGLLVPRFRIAGGLDEARHAASDLGYPVYLKSERGASASGVRLAHNDRELEKAHEEIGDPGPLLVQECIEGRQGETPVLFDNGTPLCCFSTYNHGAWPTQLNASSTRQLMRHGDEAGLAHAIGKITQFTGMCGFDWVHDPKRDRLVVIEFNPRPTPGVFLSERLNAGVDMGEAVRSWSRGQGRVVPPASKKFMPRTVPLFPQILFRSVADKDIASFLRSLAYAPWDDPLLLMAQLRRVAMHYVPASWRSGAKNLIHVRLKKRSEDA